MFSAVAAVLQWPYYHDTHHHIMACVGSDSTSYDVRRRLFNHNYYDDILYFIFIFADAINIAIITVIIVFLLQ